MNELESRQSGSFIFVFIMKKQVLEKRICFYFLYLFLYLLLFILHSIGKRWAERRGVYLESFLIAVERRIKERKKKTKISKLKRFL